MPFRRIITVVLLLAAPARVLLAQGCAMCGSSYGNADPTGQAISVSVLFMMSMPYVLASLVAGVFFVAHRRARSRQADAPVFDPPPLRTYKGDLA